MTEELRLLPWTDPHGKPCFLSSESPDSILSQFADEVETLQTDAAAKLLASVQPLLEKTAPGHRRPSDLRAALGEVTEALSEVLRIAQSRGARLPRSFHEDSDDEGDGPQLPAEAFG